MQYTHAIYLTAGQVRFLQRCKKLLDTARAEYYGTDIGTENEERALKDLEAKEATAAANFRDLVDRIKEA